MLVPCKVAIYKDSVLQTSLLIGDIFEHGKQL